MWRIRFGSILEFNHFDEKHGAPLCLALALILFLPVPRAFAGQSSFTLEQVYTKSEEASKAFKSTEANVQREYTTVIVNETEVKTGKFFYTRRGAEPRVKLDGWSNPTCSTR